MYIALRRCSFSDVEIVLVNK